jgi:hypothetical protein
MFHRLKLCAGAGHERKKVEELQRAIGTLTQEELEELRLWLDEYAGPSPLDRRIQADLATGRLDKAVQTALDDEKRGTFLLSPF